MLLNIAGCVAVSVGFSSLYVLGGIYFFSWLCLCVQRMFKPRGILIQSGILSRKCWALSDPLPRA